MIKLDTKFLPKGLDKFLNTQSGEFIQVTNPHVVVGGKNLADLAMQGYIWVMGDSAGLNEKGKTALKHAIIHEVAVAV